MFTKSPNSDLSQIVPRLYRSISTAKQPVSNLFIATCSITNNIMSTSLEPLQTDMEKIDLEFSITLGVGTKMLT